MHLKIKSIVSTNLNHEKKQALAENLSTLLKSINKKPQQLAKELDIPVITINRLLEGETNDPRISTLKLIADHFEIPVDILMYGKNILSKSNNLQNSITQLVPILEWDNLSFSDKKFSEHQEWVSVNLEKDKVLSKNSFALTSRPTLYSRFPQGSIFIIDPNIIPIDGDVVLIHFKNTADYALRELRIDPPEKLLLPLTLRTKTLEFSASEHQIIGVNMLTMLYNQRIIQ